MVINKSSFLFLWVVALCFGLAAPQMVHAQSMDAKSVKKKPDKTKSERLGKKLLDKNRCKDCHSYKGKGGCLAPPFDAISKRRSKEFIMARITDEDSQIDKFAELYGQELMPHVRLPRAQANDIANFLLSLPERKNSYKVVGHDLTSKKQKDMLSKLIIRLDYKDNQSPAEKEIDKGKRLVAEKGCQACHTIGKVGGTFGPPLDHIGSKKSLEYIARHIMAAELQPEKSKRGRDRMPALGLSVSEIESITRYLQTLK